MLGTFRFLLIFISTSFVFSSCKKDSVSNAKSYAGVYVGNVTRVEGSLNKTSTINNCTIIITSTDNSGQVTVGTDKIFFYTLIGNISGSNLTLTPKEFNNTATIVSKLQIPRKLSHLFR